MSVYDSDDARGRSPGLEPIYYKPNAPPDEPRQPQVRTPSPGEHSARRKATHFGDYILLRYIDRDQPEVALAAARGDRSPVGCHSPTDLVPDDCPHSAPRREDMSVDTRLPSLAAVTAFLPTPCTTSTARDDPVRLAQGAVQLADAAISSMNMSQHLSRPPPADVGQPSLFGSVQITRPRSSTLQTSTPQSRTHSRKRDSASGPMFGRCSACSGATPLSSAWPCRSCGGQADSDYAVKRMRESLTESHIRSTAAHKRGYSVDSFASMATSPSLQEHLIHDSDMLQDLKLPAMVAPTPQPGRSSFSPSRHLPGVSQLSHEVSLASLRQRDESGASMRPSHSRSSSRNTPSAHALLSPFQRQMPRPASMASPYTDNSPPEASNALSPASSNGGGGNRYDAHHQRVPSRQTYPPMLSHRLHSSASAGEGSLPSLTTNTSTSASSDGFTPSTVVATPTEHQPSVDTPSGAYANYPGAPVAGYKCSHRGCDAAPFTTQYLLNSHTNVHSQDRPHFCDVEGCPRSERGKNGEGGKGFKRKNEMVRHGLVHESPGYICPWCPDRAHKYPRPDNLQRHVRMHHDDKDRDDAGLRDILNQRFSASGGSSSRGRKRRGA